MLSSPSRVLSGLQLLRPSTVNFLIRERFPVQQKKVSPNRHLDEAIAWLSRAQDNGGGTGGVSAGYSLIDGWLPPYPETTGYIITTFYDYADLTGREEFRLRAQRMADWEIQVQLPSGAVQAGSYRPGTEQFASVFNTGQVILGWCRAFVETGEERYLSAALRASDWLVGAQGSDGAWMLSWPTVEALLHAFDVRVAWSLLQVDKIVGKPSYRNSAILNLEWTLRQQHEDGWFENNAFNISANKLNVPITHTIAYVMEGLWEAGCLLHNDRYFAAAEKTARPLLSIFASRGFLPGELDAGWTARASYRCLPGDAQVAAMWLRIFARSGDQRYLRAALKLIDSVKRNQSLDSRNPGIRGGIKGSEPTAALKGYARLQLPNWGAKFAADVFMLAEILRREKAISDLESGRDRRESKVPA